MLQRGDRGMNIMAERDASCAIQRYNNKYCMQRFIDSGFTLKVMVIYERSSESTYRKKTSQLRISEALGDCNSTSKPTSPNIGFNY